MVISCLAGCKNPPVNNDITTDPPVTEPPVTEAPETKAPETEPGTVLTIDELRALNNMTADEVEAKYGARKYEYTINGGTPVYSIESLPGVLLVYSGYASINDGYEPIVGSASGIILTDGYAQNIHGVYIGMDLSSAGIEWDAVNLSLNSGLSLVKTFEDLGITVGIRDAEGDIPNESNTTEEWEAWKSAYKENPTGFVHSIYVVLATETAPIPEINEADYVVKDGVLTSYVGTSIVVNIPDTVKEIAANAFANSPVAGSITEINIGANVEEISTEAFENLPNLKRVNVADANPKYRQINVFNGSNGDGSSYSAHWAWFKEGVDAAIYRKDNLLLPMELNSIPTNSPDEVVTVLCDGAELKISFIETQYTEKYAAQLHSIKYGEQVLDFDEPLPLTGNFLVYSFNFAEGYVFKRSANHDEAYIFTKDGIITMLSGNARTNGVITLSCDETGNLIYHKENVEFASDRRQTADPFSNIITGPDYYFGEDGRVEIVNGELVFITEVTYTVEDFINSQGMTMEEWFERFALFNPGSLEELYQFNKENPYDWWKSRRVYYDTTVDFRLWGYNGEDTVLNLPTAIKSIHDNAFSNSPAADKITEINIGPNVEKISINAFAGLPSLVKVNIDPANPYFTSDGKNITSADGSFSITIRTSAVTEPPVTEPPVTEPPVTEPPATEPPATEPPATEPPVTEPPVTEPPVTEPPATEPPATEPPATESPVIEPVATAGDPIKSYDSEKFVSTSKDGSEGFIIKARKFSFRSDRFVIFNVENTSNKNYTVKIRVTYKDKDGKTISSERKTHEGFAAGWQNYYVFNPGINFDSYTYTLTVSEYKGDTYTGYVSSGDLPVKLTIESSGKSWQEFRSNYGKPLKEEKTALYVNFPIVNTSSKKLYYVADYVLFDQNGDILYIDTYQIPGTVSPNSSDTVIKKQLYLCSETWENKDQAQIPEKYTSGAAGIVAYNSILTDKSARSERGDVDINEDYKFFAFSASNGMKIAYRLYLPFDYDPTKEYPVLLTLHGHGYQGNDNVKHTPDFYRFFSHPDSPAYNAIIVAPQCPEGKWWQRAPIDAVMELLEFVNDRFSTDPERQYITGISMGGCGVWDILCRYPEKVSAALPVAYNNGFGYEHEVKNPMRVYYINQDGHEKFKVISKDMIDIPIYYVYDDADQQISVTESRRLVSILKSANLKYFRYKETSGMGHSGVCYYHIDENDISLLEWLFDQRRETE